MSNRNPQSNLKETWTHRSQSWGTGAQNSAAVDCLFWKQASFFVRVGVIGSSGTVDAVVQESADGSTNWTNVPGDGPSTLAAITQLTASDTGGRIAVDCSKRKRYLRLVMTIGTAASQVATLCTQSEPVESGAATAVAWKKDT